MKKYAIIVLVLLLAAGLLFVPGLLHKKDVSAEQDAVEQVSADPSDADASQAEPVYVSDPVYGDQITEEELEQLKEQDSGEDAPAGLYVGDEYVIELEETQDTGGF